MPKKSSPKKCGRVPRLPTELPGALKLWRKFVRINKHIPDPMTMLYCYAQQMLKAGLKASTVRGRVGVPTADEAFEKQIRKHQLAALKKTLLAKHNSVGVKHKVPWSLAVQRIPLGYPDQNYTVWWYTLLATRMRPANLWHSEVCLTSEGIKVNCMQGTKSNPKRTQRPRLYRFLWSLKPDTIFHVQTQYAPANRR